MFQETAVNSLEITPNQQEERKAIPEPPEPFSKILFLKKIRIADLALVNLESTLRSFSQLTLKQKKDCGYEEWRRRVSAHLDNGKSVLGGWMKMLESGQYRALNHQWNNLEDLMLALKKELKGFETVEKEIVNSILEDRTALLKDRGSKAEIKLLDQQQQLQLRPIYQYSKDLSVSGPHLIDSLEKLLMFKADVGRMVQEHEASCELEKQEQFSQSLCEEHHSYQTAKGNSNQVNWRHRKESYTKYHGSLR